MESTASGPDRTGLSPLPTGDVRGSLNRPHLTKRPGRRLAVGNFPSVAEMTCPKCRAPMRSHKRNGVTIEQCTRCHGIFLDRGELEQLIGAESSFLGRYGAAGKAVEQP